MGYSLGESNSGVFQYVILFYCRDNSKIIVMNKARLKKCETPQIIRNRIKRYKNWSYFYIDWTIHKFNEDGD